MTKSKKIIKAWACTRKGVITYNGGTLAYLSVFGDKKSAEAFAEMTWRHTLSDVVPCEITLLPK